MPQIRRATFGRWQSFGRQVSGKTATRIGCEEGVSSCRSPYPAPANLNFCVELGAPLGFSGRYWRRLAAQRSFVLPLYTQGFLQGEEISMSSFTCPKCGSEDTHSYKAVAERGTSTGTVDVSSFNYSTGSTSHGSGSVDVTSQEAEIAAKPKRHFSMFTFFGTLLLILSPLALVFPLGTMSPFSWSEAATYIWLLLPIAGFALLLIVVGKLISRSKDGGLDERLEQWKRTWRCSRCAEAFEVNQ